MNDAVPLGPSSSVQLRKCGVEAVSIVMCQNVLSLSMNARVIARIFASLDNVMWANEQMDSKSQRSIRLGIEKPPSLHDNNFTTMELNFELLFAMEAMPLFDCTTAKRAADLQICGELFIAIVFCLRLYVRFAFVILRAFSNCYNFMIMALNFVDNLFEEPSLIANGVSTILMPYGDCQNVLSIARLKGDVDIDIDVDLDDDVDKDIKIKSKTVSMEYCSGNTSFTFKS
jgi:hypothetical protein